MSIMLCIMLWRSSGNVGTMTCLNFSTNSWTHWLSILARLTIANVFGNTLSMDNNKVEGEARKKSISKMFETCCPTFVKHRWHYRYEVLIWVTRRAQFLMWLDPSSVGGRGPDDGFGDADYSFSDAEVRCLQLLFNDKTVSACFWALSHAMRLLCEWGNRFSGWMHGCHCHPTKEDSQLSKA